MNFGSEGMTVLAVNALAHFFVDGVCVSALFSGAAEGEALTLAVVLYNTLAFSTQCLVGLLLDRSARLKLWTAAAMLLVCAGFLIPGPFLLRICIVGIGNSVFHVAGGAVTLRRSAGKAASLGLFVAPGALGVTLGTCFPQYGAILTAGLAVCAGALIFLPAVREPVPCRSDAGGSGFPLSCLLLLTAVAVRAIGGTFVRYPWKSGVTGAFLLTAFVFAGKALGGFVCDRLGAKKAALISIPAATVCIALFYGSAAASLLGQLLLNLTMPITLWLLYLAMPEAPAFVFGLAASALWPGTIVGLLFQLSGPALSICVFVSFLFGLFAILTAERIINQNQNKKEKLQ